MSQKKSFKAEVKETGILFLGEGGFPNKCASSCGCSSKRTEEESASSKGLKSAPKMTE